MRSPWALGLFLAACTFPEIEIVGQGGSSDASTSDTGAQTGGPSGGTTTGSVTSSGTGVIDCDVDMDGAQIFGPGCCTVMAECDCNDGNGDVFPGQMMFFTVKRPDKSTQDVDAFDYDCSGASEPEWAEGNCVAPLGACAPASPLHVFQPIGTYACGAEGQHRWCSGLSMCAQDAVQLGCR